MIGNHPNVMAVTVEHEVTSGNNLEVVTVVRTDLVLDCNDQNYDKDALDSLLKELCEYMKNGAGSHAGATAHT